MGYIDAHAHLLNDKLFGDISHYLAKAENAGLDKIFVSTAKQEEWQKIHEFSSDEMLILTAGIHPWYINEATENWAEELETIVASGEIKGIGEIGLDFWEGRENQKNQISFFEKQLEIANKNSLPFILHNRKAWYEIKTILKSSKNNSPWIYHNFNGSKEILREVLNLNAYVSLGGTFAKSENLQELLEFIPVERLFFESDASVIPSEKFSTKEFLPHNVPAFYKLASNIYGLPLNKLIRKIDENRKKIFK